MGTNGWSNPYAAPSGPVTPYAAAPPSLPTPVLAGLPAGPQGPGAGGPTIVYLSGYANRVVAALLDSAFAVWPSVFGYLGFLAVLGNVAPDAATDGGDLAKVLLALTVLAIGNAGTLALQIWNGVVRQGRTGQSVGKRAMGIAVVRLEGLQPMGVGLAFGRLVAHTLDGISIVGYLWPLWHPKKRTFADMICGTVVRDVGPATPRRAP